MKTVDEIIRHLESALTDANKQYQHWKDIDQYEAMKHRIRANELESLLEEIDPDAEQTEPAKVLVSDPEKKKRKISFLQVYLNIFYLFVFITSWLAVDSLLSDLIAKYDIAGSVFLHYGYGLIHTLSMIFMFVKSNLIFTEK